MSAQRPANTSQLKLKPTVYLLYLALLLANTIHAEPSSAPMVGFKPLIGGQWVLADNHQTYAWGPDQLSVFGESFTLNEGVKTLGAKGLWYFDPAAREIRGLFVATKMPFQVLHYRSRFEANTLISDIISVDRDGKELRYQERITIDQNNGYQWTLMAPGQTERSMQDRFHRIP